MAGERCPTQRNSSAFPIYLDRQQCRRESRPSDCPYKEKCSLRGSRRRGGRLGPDRFTHPDRQVERDRALRLAQGHPRSHRGRPSQRPYRRLAPVEFRQLVKLKSTCRVRTAYGARIPEPRPFRGGTVPHTGQIGRMKLSAPRGPLQHQFILLPPLTGGHLPARCHPQPHAVLGLSVGCGADVARTLEPKLEGDITGLRAFQAPA